MAALIWIGAAVTLLGVVGLMYCAQQSLRSKTLSPEAARAVMQGVVIWNVASMGVAMLGLMMVVLGLVLR